MTETQNTTQEELQICSISNLQKICEKHPKILLISTNKEREDFIQKFTDVAAPKDLDVVAVETGGSCEIVEKLGMKDTCKAILIERGKVKREIILKNDDVKDAVALMKMLSGDKKGPPRSKRTQKVGRYRGMLDDSSVDVMVTPDKVST